MRKKTKCFFISIGQCSQKMDEFAKFTRGWPLNSDTTVGDKFPNRFLTHLKGGRKDGRMNGSEGN